MNWPEWIPQWIRDFSELKPHFLFGLGAIALIILILPKGASDLLGISELRSNNQGWFGISVITFSVLGMVQLWPYVSKNIRRRKTFRRATTMLDSLNGDERFLLYYCLGYNEQTVYVRYDEPAALSLCQKSLLYRSHDGRPFAWPYTVPREIWEYLQDHRREFLPEEVSSNPELIQALNDFKQNMLRELRANR